MDTEKYNTKNKGIIRYTKELERRLFFYATIAMFLLYCFLMFFED